MHITARRVALGPSFRTELLARAILALIANAKRRGIRVIQHSIQDDHLHLMVEGGDRKMMAKKLRYLFSRIAMVVNPLAGRRGQLFRDRYHRHDLKTPREVRNALRYILFNTRKHATSHDSLDAMSSAPWFAMWDAGRAPDPAIVARARAHWPTGSPLSDPKTWLARIGWLRAGGPLGFDELPVRRH
jgi:REP element-mobilizing transposase RayT